MASSLMSLAPLVRDHHRIEHNVFGMVFGELLSDRFDQLSGRNHADFDCIRTDIPENTIQLFAQKCRSDLENVRNAGRILRSQGGDRRHGINAMCGHRLDICLNAGASAGIASSD